jgi:MFS family permease
MIGLETPTGVQSTIFGINASSVALGFAFGPLIAGGVAASTGVSPAFGVCAVLSLALAALVAIGAREPAR